MWGGYRVIKDAAVINNYVTNSIVENVNCISNRGTCFELKCFWGFVFFRDLVIDNSETEKVYGVAPDYPAIILENNAGCIFQRIKIIGDGNAENSNADGFLYSNDVATWMDKCKFENVTGNCVKTGGAGSHLYFSNLLSDGCTSDPFCFNSVMFLQVHNLEVDCTTGGNDSNGIILNSCSGAQITDCEIKNAKNNGMLLQNSKGVSVVGCCFKDSGHLGLLEKSGIGTTITDCVFDGNSKGDYIIGSKSGVIE